MTRLIGFAWAFVAASGLGSGVLLVHTRAARLSGWFLVGAGASGLLGLWLLDAAGNLPAGRLLLVLAGLVLLPAALWAYPSPRWHRLVDQILAAALIGPGLVACLYTQDSAVLITLGVVAFFALVAQMWWRLERSEDLEQRALAWVALTMSVSVLVSLTIQFIAPTGFPVVLAVVILASVPLAMVIGILRPDTVDVRGLAVAASVAGALLIGYVAYYVGVLAVLQLLGVASPQPLVLAVIGLLGGVALHPVAAVLRGVMDQILFGERPDPLDTATKVVSAIGHDPDEALTTVRTGLALPYVALWRADQLLAQSGQPVAHVRRIVAHAEAETQTTLEVGIRAGDLRLSPGDAHVLQLVTPLLVQLVRATELSVALQQSRAQALADIADERRRLRNELHDDLGPTLTGIALTTDAARNLLPADAPATRDLLDAVRLDAANAIEQVRHIVYGMRPPALDELGLVDALRQQARGLRSPAGEALPVEFVQTGDLTALPAAVEVAAYRIVMEAVTNVARHSESGSATVVMENSGGTLLIEVMDTGKATVPWQDGVGLASMRERVAELGGSLQAGPGEGGGRVRAVLPASLA